MYNCVANKVPICITRTLQAFAFIAQIYFRISHGRIVHTYKRNGTYITTHVFNSKANLTICIVRVYYRVSPSRLLQSALTALCNTVVYWHLHSAVISKLHWKYYMFLQLERGVSRSMTTLNQDCNVVLPISSRKTQEHQLTTIII